jgi:hypothetical protein
MLKAKSTLNGTMLGYPTHLHNHWLRVSGVNGHFGPAEGELSWHVHLLDGHLVGSTAMHNTCGLHR